MRTSWVFGALVLAAAMPLADAKPARPDDMLEIDEPPVPCMRGKTWSIVATCLAGIGRAHEIYSAPDVHVMHVQPTGAPGDSGAIHIYAQSGTNEWTRLPIILTTGSSSELLGASALETPKGRGVQVKVGETLRPLVALDGTVARTPSVVKRELTAFCVPGTWTCNVLVTRCTTYIGGRAYWAFDGQLVWHETLGVRLRGDSRLAEGMCKVSPSLVLDPGTP